MPSAKSDVWRWIAVTAVGVVGILLAALATSYSADAEESVKAVRAECMLAEGRCKEYSFPRIDGRVLENDVKHIKAKQEKMDRKLDKILEAVSK